MHIVVGPVLTRMGGYAFDCWTPEEGLSRGYGIVKLTVSSEKNIKRSRRSHCSDRVVPLVGRLGSGDPQRGA